MIRIIQKNRLVSFLLISLLLPSLAPLGDSQHQPTAPASEQANQVDVIVYTAIQEWPSKSWIYLLALDGTPITSYSYDWYLFNDVEVVNNEVYVTDWVCPPAVQGERPDRGSNRHHRRLVFVLHV